MEPNWSEETDYALQRAGSSCTSGDLIAYLRKSQAVFMKGEKMHASWLFRGQGIEVGHIFGNWWPEDVSWFLDVGKREAEARGMDADIYHITGRPGWRRFLKAKGFPDGLSS